MPATKEEKFEQYFTKYYQQVYGYVVRKVLNHETAEDLAMDAFYVCWSQFERFDREKASFHTWLFVIVNNKLKNYYRDHKITEELDDADTMVYHQEDELLESVQLQQLRNHLYNAMEQLPDLQKKIVVYRYFKNMNSKEIAEQTGLSPGNVRVRLARATEKIKDYFNERDIRWD